MNPSGVLEALRRFGAINEEGHFALASGRHSSTYVDPDKLYIHANVVAQCCGAIARYFAAKRINVVVGPANGGIILSQNVARLLTKYNILEVLAAYTERPTGHKVFTLTRGHHKIVTGRKVLVVDDIATSGGSLRETIQATRQAGGTVVGVAVICNRGGVTAAHLDDPPPTEFFWLCQMELESWPEADCPLCQKGVPINTDIGHGREFLARKALQQ